MTEGLVDPYLLYYNIMLILNKQDAIYSATKLIKYFKDFNRIDDYFRARKIERVKNIPQALPGMGLDDDMFQSYDNSFIKRKIFVRITVVA